MKRKILVKSKIRESFTFYIQNYSFRMLITLYPTSIFVLSIIFVYSLINNLLSTYLAKVKMHCTANMFQSHIQVMKNV